METEALTPAAQIIIAIIPVAGITFATILIFFALLWRHHETKLRILKGCYSPSHFNLRAFSLLAGLCLIGTGLVLTTMFLLLTGKSWGLLGGLLPLAIGLALTIFAKIAP